MQQTYVFCTFLFQELCILTPSKLLSKYCTDMGDFDDDSKSLWNMQIMLKFQPNDKVN